MMVEPLWVYFSIDSRFIINLGSDNATTNGYEFPNNKKSVMSSTKTKPILRSDIFGPFADAVVKPSALLTGKKEDNLRLGCPLFSINPNHPS